MSNQDLTADQVRDLRALAGMIIPASAVYNVPGADDDKIFDDILRNLERDRDDIRRALSHLAAIGGAAFADLDAEHRADVAKAFREVGGAPLAASNATKLPAPSPANNNPPAVVSIPVGPFPPGKLCRQAILPVFGSIAVM